MRILIITPSFPYPMVSGDDLRLYNLLLRITKEHQVWIAALTDTLPSPEGLTHLREICRGIEIYVRHRRPAIAQIPNLVRYTIASKPMEPRYYRSDEFAEKIWQLAKKIDFDIVQFEHSEMALYSELFPPTMHCKSILVIHNITAQQFARISRIERKPTRKIRAMLFSLFMGYWEPRYAGRFDRCITVSEINRLLLQKINPNLQVDVIPNGTDTKRFQLLPPESNTPTVLFVGSMGYKPNADAAQFFCNKILPKVKQTVGNLEMLIVGKEPTPQVLKLEGDGVHIIGRVEDMIPYYRRSAVSVVPLRAGGGTRLKILEAMALGRPVVSTTIGCEGLDVRDGEHLLIADNPEEFAAKTIQLLIDKKLHQRITINARQLVESRYDWDAIAGKLLKLYDEMAG